MSKIPKPVGKLDLSGLFAYVTSLKRGDDTSEWSRKFYTWARNVGAVDENKKLTSVGKYLADAGTRDPMAVLVMILNAPAGPARQQLQQYAFSKNLAGQLQKEDLGMLTLYAAGKLGTFEIHDGDTYYIKTTATLDDLERPLADLIGVHYTIVASAMRWAARKGAWEIWAVAPPFQVTRPPEWLMDDRILATGLMGHRYDDYYSQTGMYAEPQETASPPPVAPPPPPSRNATPPAPRVPRGKVSFSLVIRRTRRITRRSPMPQRAPQATPIPGRWSELGLDRYLGARANPALPGGASNAVSPGGGWAQERPREMARPMPELPGLSGLEELSRRALAALDHPVQQAIPDISFRADWSSDSPLPEPPPPPPLPPEPPEREEPRAESTPLGDEPYRHATAKSPQRAQAERGAVRRLEDEREARGQGRKAHDREREEGRVRAGVARGRARLKAIAEEVAEAVLERYLELMPSKVARSDPPRVVAQTRGSRWVITVSGGPEAMKWTRILEVGASEIDLVNVARLSRRRRANQIYRRYQTKEGIKIIRRSGREGEPGYYMTIPLVYGRASVKNGRVSITEIVRRRNRLPGGGTEDVRFGGQGDANVLSGRVARYAGPDPEPRNNELDADPDGLYRRARLFERQETATQAPRVALSGRGLRVEAVEGSEALRRVVTRSADNDRTLHRERYWHNGEHRRLPRPEDAGSTAERFVLAETGEGRYRWKREEVTSKQGKITERDRSRWGVEDIAPWKTLAAEDLDRRTGGAVHVRPSPGDASKADIVRFRTVSTRGRNPPRPIPSRPGHRILEEATRHMEALVRAAIAELREARGGNPTQEQRAMIETLERAL